MASRKRKPPAPSPASGYWREATRPVVCLAFVAPMLIVYEIGVLGLGAAATRNAVDVWLRHTLEFLGFGQYFLLPLLTGSILLAWHHATGEKWRFRSVVLAGMLVESSALAMLLLVIAKLQGTLFAAIPCAAQGDMRAADLSAKLVAYFGAGIYEELLFRLMLLPAMAAVIGYFGGAKGWRLAGAVLLTSLIFSALHFRFLNSAGEAFEWYSFTFRFCAGIFFSLLFVHRGFGVAAGTHALYDILTVVAQ